MKRKWRVKWPGGAIVFLLHLVHRRDFVPLPSRPFAYAARGRGRSIVNAPYNPRTLFKRPQSVPNVSPSVGRRSGSRHRVGCKEAFERD